MTYLSLVTYLLFLGFGLVLFGVGMAAVRAGAFDIAAGLFGTAALMAYYMGREDGGGR